MSPNVDSDASDRENVHRRLTPMGQINWDDEFANAVYIPGGLTFPVKWKQQAQQFLGSHYKRDLNLPYGSHSRQTYDLIWPTENPRGLVVFVHGGYWLDFDKSYWTHLAKGPIERGFLVAITSYVLAPEARIFEITEMIVRALHTIADHVSGPISLVGHSAGGHLVTRMHCKDSGLSSQLQERLATTVSISGLHDLRNLVHTSMNKLLGLSTSESVAESSALHEPQVNAQVVCWVGGSERPEFLRQAKILKKSWKDKVRSIEVVIEEDRHHFDVIESMCDPNSRLTSAICGETD